MPKYLVNVCWREYGTVTVDAATPEEAAKRACDMNPDDVNASGVDDWKVFENDIEEV